MKIVENVSRWLKPKLELEAARYYQEFLKQEDAALLKTFVLNLGRLSSTTAAVLAVGSSTFPKVHWEHNAALNRINPGMNVPMSYRDIDLLIVPERQAALPFLEDSVRDALTGLHMNYTLNHDTAMGLRYDRARPYRGSEEITIPVSISIGLHSFETALRNGRRLDLILGKERESLMTAEQKIAAERREKCAFSILYRG